MGDVRRKPPPQTCTFALILLLPLAVPDAALYRTTTYNRRKPPVQKRGAPPPAATKAELARLACTPYAAIDPRPANDTERPNVCATNKRSARCNVAPEKRNAVPNFMFVRERSRLARTKKSHRSHARSAPCTCARDRATEYVVFQLTRTGLPPILDNPCRSTWGHASKVVVRMPLATKKDVPNVRLTDVPRDDSVAPERRNRDA